MLETFSDLFQGNLGVWPDEEIGVELVAGAQPCHRQRPIQIAHVHVPTLKKEIDRLVEIGALEQVEG